MKIFFCALTSSVYGAGDKRTKCGSCEQLVDGVNRVMKETFKQNFGGGNTQWEEAKLKKKNINWVSSESRLLEVLENACGGGYGNINLNSMDIEKAGKNTGCHNLLELEEEWIEEWFYTKPEERKSDLREEFCVEQMKYCCSDKTKFGSRCEKRCPTNKKGEICSNQGTCLGGGDKMGPGICQCNTGYTGSFCHHCSRDHFINNNLDCEACDKACEECDGPTDADCKICSKGYAPIEYKDKIRCKSSGDRMGERIDRTVKRKDKDEL